MKLYSTNDKNNIVSFKDAVIHGIAKDGGLFMPTEIPILDKIFFETISDYSLNEIAFKVSEAFLKDDLTEDEISSIISAAFDFSAPLTQLDENINILELFHGPTLAFKDFGARFMAQTLSTLNKKNDKEITILVATSGDTGSAVANGFYKSKGINVILLYPSGKVSKLQEQQLTTLNENITALEVEGTFDDCQRLVKSAFKDNEIKQKLTLSSANSINIARLLPQSFYYFYAYAQLKDKTKKTIISVPSGNFGNLTAGLFSRAMGLPIDKFIAATNSNDVFPKYLESGKFLVKPSVLTISNAMDVGNPSNLARIQALYDNDVTKIRDVIFSSSFSDDQTKAKMKDVFDTNKYVIDPHGAVGFLALEKYLEENNINNYNGIVLETAHPAKFIDIVEEVIKHKIEIPDRLKACLEKKKNAIKTSNKFTDFKEYLMQK